MHVVDAVTTVERCRALVAVAFPGIDVGRVAPLGAGWDGTAFTVGDRLVFRFPRRAEVAARLRVEVALLAELGPALPLPVPRPDHVAPGALDFPWTFAGYPLLRGVPLDAVALDDPAIGRVADDLGRFLAALHRFPADRAAALGVPAFTPERWVERTAALWERALPVVAVRLGDERAARLDGAWRARLADRRLLDFTPVLVHGDLALEHVLVDPESGRVGGVIDFTDAMVADPALDYAGLPEALARRVQAASGESGGASFWARWAFCRAATPLHAVLAGRQLGRDDLLEEGLARLDRQAAGGG
ncbi:MAG TPA: phosphotransferase [Thermomicrobiaceae bacterium]|nr:phosphotransferase [Thermomicrobiaceae bacterium]